VILSGKSIGIGKKGSRAVFKDRNNYSDGYY